MLSGASSLDRTRVKDVRAETMVLSVLWKAGQRDGMMLGVRTRIEGGGGGLRIASGFGEVVRVVKRGRKVCNVRMGCKSRLLRRSESVLGERAATGEEG